MSLRARKNAHTTLWPLLCAVLFAAFACALLPKAGIEGDEAIFTKPIFQAFRRDYGVTIFHHHIALMVFPYIGSLKTLLYWPILKAFPPNPWSLRLPVVLIGAVTLILFFHFCRKVAGIWPACLATLLLATDPSYILTDTFDWGPVALEHLLLIGGCLLIVSRRPAWGFFLFGLALWNKAIFVWALAGLTAAVAVACFPEVRRFCADRRRLCACAAAFTLGTAPLLIYNLHSWNATARANIHPSFEGFSAKVQSLKQTLEGSDLFGVIVSPESQDHAKQPSSVAGRIAGGLARIWGRRGRTLFVYGILLALITAPLWWRSRFRRAALFAAVFSAISFLTMAAVRYTGAAHHIVLLYPMPQLLVAAALGAWPGRWLAWLSAAALVAANLMVTNQYIFEIEKFGAYGVFTDAMEPLAQSLDQYQDKTVYAVDLLIGDSMDLLERGRGDIRRETMVMPLSDAEVTRLVLNPRGVFVDRLPEAEFYKGSNERLTLVAHANGYEPHILQRIFDSNGREQFEIFRFDRNGATRP